MNYEQRSLLQKKLQQFTDEELKDFVVEKEYTERMAKKEKFDLFLFYQ